MFKRKSDLRPLFCVRKENLRHEFFPLRSYLKTKGSTLVVSFRCLEFSPWFVGDSWSNLTCAYFSRGLVQPPTRIQNWNLRIKTWVFFPTQDPQSCGNEQWKKKYGRLGDIGDENLHSYMEIIINHEIRIHIKQPRIQWKVRDPPGFSISWLKGRFF